MDLIIPEQKPDEQIPANQFSEAGAIAREQARIQSAVISAKKFPRDETAAFTRIIKAFKRPTLAKVATYAFPRGGKKITGASVDCARQLGAAWGNINWGFEVTSLDNEIASLRGFAVDLETNTTIEAGDRFRILVQRKVGNTTAWVAPDERDLRELINRRAAILIRNCILQLVPPDITDAALEQAKTTLRAVADGELKENREDIIRSFALAFDQLGVTVENLEKYLGHKVSELNADELTELRGVYKSIKDGHTKRNDHFDFGSKSGEQSEDAKEVDSLLGSKKTKTKEEK